MKSLERALMAVVLLWVCTWLSGCGGGAGSGHVSSQDGQPSETASLEDIASAHLSSVIMVKRWVKVLYGIGAETGQQCTPALLQTQQVDANMTKQVERRSDCSTWDYVYDKSSGAAHGTATYTDGSVSQFDYSPITFQGGRYQVSTVEIAYADEAVINYTFTGDLRTGDVTEQGTCRLADGALQSFLRQTSKQRRPWEDSLDSSVEGDSTLTWRTPLTTTWQPIFSSSATGRFATASGLALDFSLRGPGGTQQGWTEWVVSAPPGLRGEFGLAQDFSGSGQFKDAAGKVTAAFSWDSYGQGRLDSVDGGQSSPAASATILDFNIDRWIQQLGAFSPVTP